MLVLLLLAVPVGVALLAAGVESLVGISRRTRTKNLPARRTGVSALTVAPAPSSQERRNPCPRVSMS